MRRLPAEWDAKQGLLRCDLPKGRSLHEFDPLLHPERRDVRKRCRVLHRFLRCPDLDLSVRTDRSRMFCLPLELLQRRVQLGNVWLRAVTARGS